ncbi:H-NS histone family protein [Pseudorhodoferax sp.]|jgi:DNA-binding protein H-NS|uniref:H-NS histone family protein n=1 Tax=Pseudorhodoferax sp. TaxID=1993553 RepID=UPI001B57EFC7|nr:H-NS histone family protein [Pseudorhodoferax sp.]MBP8144079.1 H-NS histone family protein [Inhella sp.]
MATLQELMAQRSALDKQIEETQARDRGAAVAKVKSLMAEYGLTLADLNGRAKGAPKAPSRVAPKYRNNATGETWTGRGLKPKWLQAALNGGAKLEDFII